MNLKLNAMLDVLMWEPEGLKCASAFLSRKCKNCNMTSCDLGNVDLDSVPEMENWGQNNMPLPLAIHSCLSIFDHFALFFTNWSSISHWIIYINAYHDSNLEMYDVSGAMFLG